MTTPATICWTIYRAVAAPIVHHWHRVAHPSVGKLVRHAIRHHAHIGHPEARAVWNAIRVCLSLGALLLAAPPVLRLLPPTANVPASTPRSVLQAPTPVPEPASLGLLAGAVLGLLVVRRRGKQPEQHRNPARNVLRALNPTPHRALVRSHVSRKGPLGISQAGQCGAEVGGGHRHLSRAKLETFISPAGDWIMRPILAWLSEFAASWTANTALAVNTSISTRRRFEP